MNEFHFAVNDLIQTARAGSFEETIDVSERVLELIEKSQNVPPNDAGWAINHLAPLLADPRYPNPPLVWTAEALLRCGADPWSVLGLILERLMDTIETSASLVRESDDRTLEGMKKHAKSLAASAPRRAMAWASLQPMCGICVPLVEHFPHARQLMRSRESIAPALAEIGPFCEPAKEIARLLDAHAAGDPQEAPNDNVERALENLTDVCARAAENGNESTPALRELMTALFCV